MSRGARAIGCILYGLNWYCVGMLLRQILTTDSASWAVVHAVLAAGNVYGAFVLLSALRMAS